MRLCNLMYSHSMGARKGRGMSDERRAASPCLLVSSSQAEGAPS